MFAASELPVAERTLEVAFIGHVDAARGVGTESAVSVMPSRCWRLGLAGSWALLLQKIMAALHSDALYFLLQLLDNTSNSIQRPDKMTDDETLRASCSPRVNCRSHSGLWGRLSLPTWTLPV